MPAPPLETNPGAPGNRPSGGSRVVASAHPANTAGRAGIPSPVGGGGGNTVSVPVHPASEAPLSLSRDDARDMALVQAHRGGDRNALSELLTSYQDRLFGVCLRMTNDSEAARDLAQESMVKIITGIGQFNGHSKLSTWLIRITMNVCLTDRRRQRIRKTISLDSPNFSGGGGSGTAHGPIARVDSTGYRGLSGEAGARGAGTLGDHLDGSREPTAAERVIRSEDRERLYAAMDALEPPQRAMLILRDVQNLDYRQIAEVLDIPEGTVKSRLFRARLALREAMLRDEGEA